MLRTSAAAARLGARNLLQDRTRLFLSALGVGLALMLVLLLLGLRAGVLRSTGIYLEQAPGTFVLVPQGVRNTTSASSARFLPPDVIDAAAATPGVASAVPVLLTTGFADLHGTKEVIKLIGYDVGSEAGPWDLAGGREPREDGEVVLDRILASRHRVGIGDELDLAGRRLRVVGLSDQTSSFIGNYAFALRTTVEALVLAPGSASLLLITVQPGTSADELVARLTALGDTEVLRKTDVMANDRRLVAGIFDQVILLMTGAAMLVGALVVGLVIYTASNERRAEYGILKALGAATSVLYRAVALQALMAAGLGSIMGIMLAIALGRVIMALRPQFLVEIEPRAVAVALAGGLIMSIAGAILPAYLAGRLEPADVFRR